MKKLFVLGAALAASLAGQKTISVLMAYADRSRQLSTSILF